MQNRSTQNQEETNNRFLCRWSHCCCRSSLVSRQLSSLRNQVLQPPSSPLAEMTVSVVHPETVPSTTVLNLPGQLQAYTDAPIFAQTSGYLKAWHFDIRAKVKANDILAEIDTPEVENEKRLSHSP
jgi:multidrug efflux pump subunit AcrA (membrane-fusion protein)